jgi:hypothetical protein
VKTPVKPVKRAAVPVALFVTVLIGVGAPRLSRADTIIRVDSPPPDFVTFGSPQPVQQILLCSDIISTDCGGFSDTLLLKLLGRNAVSGALTEAGEIGNPILFPIHAGAIDIRIPNAVWLFPAWYVFRESTDPAFGDNLIFYNLFAGPLAGAHLWLGSDDQDPPLFPVFPTDDQGNIVFDPSAAGLTETDISSLVGPDGTLDATSLQPSGGFMAPEPSIFGLVGIGMGCLFVLRRRNPFRS